MRTFLKISDYSVFQIWLLHSAIICLLAYINPNHYTTIDSHYYLESAESLLSGKGYSVPENHISHWNSTFPFGYSLSIAIVSSLTDTNVLIASKLVNITASGIWLIYLNRWFGKERTIVLSCILFLGSFLKLWAHTWSEPLFLIVLFCWTYKIYMVNKHSQISKKNVIYSFFLGVLLISVRYAGIFIIPLTLAFCLNSFQKKSHSKAILFACLSFGWTTFFVFYLLLNKYQSGEWFGGQRFNGNIAIIENFAPFSKGILNELLIPDINYEMFSTIFIILIVIQILVVILIFKQTNQTIKRPPPMSVHLWLAAFVYLLFLFAARVLSPFDEPGYRLLAPFSFLAMTGFCLTFDFHKFSNRIKYFVFILIVFSWLDLMPRHGLKIKLLQVLSAITVFI